MLEEQGAGLEVTQLEALTGEVLQALVPCLIVGLVEVEGQT